MSIILTDLHINIYVRPYLYIEYQVDEYCRDKATVLQDVSLEESKLKSLYRTVIASIAVPLDPE